MPWGVKPVTNVAPQRPTRQKSQLLPSARWVGRPTPCGHFVNLTKRAKKLTAPSATSHNLRMTLEKPSSVLSARKWWHSSSGAATRSSTPFYLSFCFMQKKSRTLILRFFSSLTVFCFWPKYFNGNRKFSKIKYLLRSTHHAEPANVNV